MTREEEAVWKVLAIHRGRKDAVKLSTVAFLTDLTERDVQFAVSALIETHGLSIGSSCQRPTGYYIIETPEELEQSLGQLSHRITALAKRIAALKKSTLPLVLNQLAIELEEVKA